MKQTANPSPICTEMLAKFQARYEHLWTLIEQAVESQVSALLQQSESDASSRSKDVGVVGAAIRLLESAVRSLARAQECRARILSLTPTPTTNTPLTSFDESQMPLPHPTKQPDADPVQSSPVASPAKSSAPIPPPAVPPTIPVSHSPAKAGAANNHSSANPSPANKSNIITMPNNGNHIAANKHKNTHNFLEKIKDIPLLYGLSGSYSHLRELAAVPL